MSVYICVSHSVVSNSDPMDCSPLVSSVHGLLQARILEWVPLPSPGDLSNPGIKPRPPALQADSLPSESPGNSHHSQDTEQFHHHKGISHCPFIPALLLPLVRFLINYWINMFCNLESRNIWRSIYFYNIIFKCFIYQVNCCHSVTKWCPTLCNCRLSATHMDCSTPGSSVLYCHPVFAQIHVL